MLQKICQIESEQAIFALARGKFRTSGEGSAANPVCYSKSGVVRAVGNVTAKEKADKRAAESKNSTTSLLLDHIIRTVGVVIVQKSIQKYCDSQNTYAGSHLKKLEESFSDLDLDAAPSPRSPTSSDSSELSSDLGSPIQDPFYYLAAQLQEETSCEHCEIAQKRAVEQAVEIANLRQTIVDGEARFDLEQKRSIRLQHQLEEARNDLVTLYYHNASVSQLPLSPAGKAAIWHPGAKKQKCIDGLVYIKDEKVDDTDSTA